MSQTVDVAHYNAELVGQMGEIGRRLARVIAEHLPQAESKVWHGHPVWFLAGNPIVGYSQTKAGMSLLFWSGQSFDEPGLKPEGKFKAAGCLYVEAADVDEVQLAKWLKKAQMIQWDYKNIVKRQGVLERLV